MLRRQPANGVIVNSDQRQRGRLSHPADEYDREGQIKAARAQPGTVTANFGDGPDNAIDLTRQQIVQQMVNIIRGWTMDQIETCAAPILTRQTSHAGRQRAEDGKWPLYACEF